MKMRIFNLIIIDESGSMISIKKEAIDNVNETIQTIRSAQKKHEEQEHYISLVSFNNEVKTIYDCLPISEIQEINEDTYLPNCYTALYDAIGSSVNSLRKKVSQEDKVLITIITDGYENVSEEYNGIAIKSLIEELKSKGWVFAYIGANHDVEQVAATISISNTIKFEQTSLGTQNMTGRLNRCRNHLYDSMSDAKGTPSFDIDNFFCVD